MAYIHSEGVAHLDLKPGNVMIANEGDAQVVKVADFGEQFDERGAKNNPYGTHGYMAPEAWHRDYGAPCAKADVFSFAVILWELYTQRRPHTGFTQFEPEMGHTPADTTQWMADKGQRPQIPSPCPVLWSLLVEACWVSRCVYR